MMMMIMMIMLMMIIMMMIIMMMIMMMIMMIVIMMIASPWLEISLLWSQGTLICIRYLKLHERLLINNKIVFWEYIVSSGSGWKHAC